MIYIRLFHGRNEPSQHLNDWGSDGPIFGPYKFIHTIYATYIKLGVDDEMHELHVTNDNMVYYDGVYYGDWSVFGHDELVCDGFKLSVFDQDKAK